MRLIGDASADEMVLAFVRAEIDAPRYRAAYAGVDRRLIDKPDLTDATQNLHRKAVLSAYRRVYLEPLPADTSWQRWALTPAELGDVLYANRVATWEILSGGTRRIRDGAVNARGLAVVTELGVDVAVGIRQTSRAIDTGQPMAELIAVAADPAATSLVLLEGHTRATAYLVASKPPAEVTVLVGWSTSMTTWPWF